LKKCQAPIGYEAYDAAEDDLNSNIHSAFYKVREKLFRPADGAEP
jgi:hypothetical protein